MRPFALYLAVALLAFGNGFLESIPNVNAQNSKKQSFYIESQPDSPLLIRDLTATILPKNNSRISPQIEVTLYIENRSKKKVKEYGYGDRAANGSNDDELDERGFDSQGLLSGESRRETFTYSVEVESLIYRIGFVEFEDGTKWKAKLFNAVKAKKSAPITATVQKANENSNSKRILTREWTTPIFIDRVTKTLEGKPQVIEEITIQTKLHEIKAEDLDYVEYCLVEENKIEVPNGEIIYVEQDDRVEKFTTYEIKGRVFAYIVPYEAIEAETQYEIGVGFQSIYVDEDGSGIFKLRCKERELKSLPQWVKTLAGK